MAKVVPNAVKGTVLHFEPWNRVKTAGENYTTKFRTVAVFRTKKIKWGVPNNSSNKINNFKFYFLELTFTFKILDK